jgi:hypothetical protein
VNRLVRLYPRDWRERYGAELDVLVADLAAERPGIRGQFTLALDLIQGALDAWRLPVRKFWSDAALRRGLYDGLIIAAVGAVLIVLTNVVFPQGPTESDDDPEYLWQILTAYALIGLAFVFIGMRGARRTGSAWGGFRAGAAAGFVIGLLVIAEFLVVDNLWFGTISRQHDKMVTFAASGWTSYRAWVTVQLLRGLPFVLVFGTFVAGALGYFGGVLGRRQKVLGA